MVLVIASSLHVSNTVGPIRIDVDRLEPAVDDAKAD
jgi:hypothetical protein